MFDDMNRWTEIRLAALLSERGIAIRAGHHCALPLHRALGITASARISFSYFNTRDEIDSFIKALTEIQESFAGRLGDEA